MDEKAGAASAHTEAPKPVRFLQIQVLQPSGVELFQCVMTRDVDEIRAMPFWPELCRTERAAIEDCVSSRGMVDIDQVEYYALELVRIYFSDAKGVYQFADVRLC
jgi:hypothetical protein